MKIKRENYKTIDLFSYIKSLNISDNDANYFIDSLNLPTVIDKKTYTKAIKKINRLKKEPIQYVLGNTNFYGHEFKVNKHTLIPRFETEELVENTITLIKEHLKDNINILDVGTGSGCIGITLKRKLPKSNVTISDISKKTLKVAKENVKELDIKIVKGNLLKPFINKQNKYNVIISNPPYISYKENIDKKVKNNEPHRALFAKNNGLFYYEEILKDIKHILDKEFIIAFEIGMTQKEDIINLINKYLTNIKIISKQDLQERDRMIFVKNLTNS